MMMMIFHDLFPKDYIPSDKLVANLLQTCCKLAHELFCHRSMAIKGSSAYSQQVDSMKCSHKPPVYVDLSQ